MVVLSIARLDNVQSTGTNINIPKFVKYLNQKCDSGYLDLGNEELINFKGFKNYFKINDINSFSLNTLPKPFDKPDIIVFQGFYIFDFIKIARELKKNNIPYAIVPRCSLTKEAQNMKKIKKIVGNILYFNKFVKDAKFIHFLTKNEYLESKKAFKFKDYVIIGNGIELPDKEYEVKEREQFKVTFVGRYNVYHKGLDVLFDAIKMGQEYFRKNNFKFVLYGRDSSGGLKILTDFIRNNNLYDLIEIKEAVFGQDKEKALLDSDVFIHTSRLEGHPTSVIEAIAYGIPVIVTPGTNVLDEVKNNNLGFTCNLNKEEIFECIKKSYESKKEFYTISKNEIEYAKINFDWNKIATNILKFYEQNY